ncbi:MAG: hypothetical protein MUC42_00435 [Bryobacter sp.]|jgi:hypothetical protein|nr:hypothetical protein [Bryobacter sp.]
MRRLSAPEFDAVETHLAECAFCRARAREWNSFITAVRDAAPGAARPRVSPQLHWQWAMAAAFLLSFAGFLWLRPSTGQPALVTVETWRGEGTPSTTAPARRPLTLELREPTALPGAGFELQFVDTAGRVMVTGQGKSFSEGSVRWEIGRAFAPGVYWVRLSRGGVFLREYALRVD